MYLLDTNICIYAVKNIYPKLTKKLLHIPPSEIAVSAITVGELEYGSSKSKWGEKSRHIMNLFLSPFKILSFDRDDAILFGQLRSALAKAGTPIGPYDIQIATQGISRHMIIVTHNTTEFARVPGIVLEDWCLEQ